MTRLTKVELRRLFSRRLTLIAVLGALAVAGMMLFGTFMQAKPLTGRGTGLPASPARPGTKGVEGQR